MTKHEIGQHNQRRSSNDISTTRKNNGDNKNEPKDILEKKELR